MERGQRRLKRIGSQHHETAANVGTLQSCIQAAFNRKTSPYQAFAYVSLYSSTRASSGPDHGHARCGATGSRFLVASTDRAQRLDGLQHIVEVERFRQKSIRRPGRTLLFGIACN